MESPGCGTCLEVFANKLRMDVLTLLKKQKMNVTELVDALGVERTRISHALIELKKCHIITGEKNGREIHYRINKNTPLDATGSLFELIDQHTKANCPSCHRTGEKLVEIKH